MLFNSLEFGVFLLFTVWAWGAARGRAKHFVLLAASYLFYASWNPWYLLLLAYSTLLDFCLGRALGSAQSPRWRRLLLVLSVVGNLSVLVVFKYADFFLSSVGIRGITQASQTFHVVGAIPPGLSFYTFQSLAYTIDVYRREAPVCRSLTDFALYIAFFPQLIAGPIVRSYEFLPQIALQRRRGLAETLQAVELFVVGLIKKVVIADNIGIQVDAIFARPEACQGSTLWLGAVLFAIQIYCDFSGYSTMARGLAKLFGYELPRNFDYPYLATNPMEYYRAWHITMSNWFQDYVFGPLAGTSRNPVRVALSLLVTWLLFGLWHGAAWTYVSWGLYNGLVLLAYRALVRAGARLPRLPAAALLGWLLTFLALLPGAVLFRATSLGDAGASLGRMLRMEAGGHSAQLAWWWFVAGLFAIMFVSRRRYDENLLARVSWPVRIALLGLATLLVALTAPESRPFIYFQF